MSASSSLLPMVMALGVDMARRRGWQQHRTPSRKMSRPGHVHVAADSPTHFLSWSTSPSPHVRGFPLFFLFFRALVRLLDLVVPALCSCSFGGSLLLFRSYGQGLHCCHISSTLFLS